MKSPVQIDIEKVFKEKNPAAARLIPRFIFNWIKSTIHEAEINQFLREEHGTKGVVFATNILKAFGVKQSCTGLMNIPETGGAIVASNHPLGGLDGMVLLCQTSQARKDVKFIVNDILMNLPQFEDVFIGINKTGVKAREQLNAIEDTYASQQLLLIFPAGLCSRKKNGTIRDGEWNKAFISRAIKYKKDIIPAHINGKNSSRFYNVANVRKFLGLKANLEMFFLPDEMFRQKDKEVNVQFGSPIPYSYLDNRFTHHQWAQLIKEYVYTIRTENIDFPTFVDHRPHHFSHLHHTHG